MIGHDGKARLPSYEVRWIDDVKGLDPGLYVVQVDPGPTRARTLVIGPIPTREKAQEAAVELHLRDLQILIDIWRSRFQCDPVIVTEPKEMR